MSYIKKGRQQWKNVWYLLDNIMYLLWLHVKNATVHNKNYLNITVASQILAKYISSISSTSVSQTTSIIFKDLEITGSKGITLTLLFFLTYTFLLLLINVTVSLRVPMRLFFFWLCKKLSITLSVGNKIKPRELFSTSSYICRLDKVWYIFIK